MDEHREKSENNEKRKIFIFKELDENNELRSIKRRY